MAAGHDAARRRDRSVNAVLFRYLFAAWGASQCARAGWAARQKRGAEGLLRLAAAAGIVAVIW
jgi:hypothetical protein